MGCARAGARGRGADALRGCTASTRADGVCGCRGCALATLQPWGALQRCGRLQRSAARSLPPPHPALHRMFRSVITLGALAAAQASFTLTSYSSKDCSGESSAVSNLKVGCNNAGDFSFSITAVGAGYSATSFIGKDCPGDSIAVSFAAGAVDSCLPGSTSGVPAGCV